MRILRNVMFAVGLAALAAACGGKDKAADTSNTGGDDMGGDMGGDEYGGDGYGDMGGEDMGGEDMGGGEEGMDEGME